MAVTAHSTLRYPLILLAMVDLYLLVSRVWPPQDWHSLPNNGVPFIDLAVVLVGYAGFISFIGSYDQGRFSKELETPSLLGLLAGMVLMIQVIGQNQVATTDAQPSHLISRGLLVAATLLFGFSGISGARAAGNSTMGLVGGVWSALIACLMAASTILAQMYFNGPPPMAQDAWQQYEGLAVGNPAAQALLHSVYLATGFLLVGPIVGVASGTLFAFVGGSGKK